MKLANCNEHPDANNRNLTCWALRHDDGSRVTDDEMFAIIKTIPNLDPVISWLENGCDPKEAAKELRIYQHRMRDILYSFKLTTGLKRRAKMTDISDTTNPGGERSLFRPLVRPIAEAWCVIDPQGNVEISSDWKTENDAWRVRLGWPTCGEVKYAKANGWRCERVSIFPVE